MGLADYYRRGAVAASQVLAGFNEDRFRERLLGTTVGISFGADALGPEGRALTDLLVRLTARLYPSLAIRGDRTADGRVAELRDLARAINPAVDLDEQPTIEVVVGVHAPAPIGTTTVFAGSEGWDSLISLRSHQAVGGSFVPFGAGVSACLATANVFRSVFLGANAHLDSDVIFSVYNGSRGATAASAPTLANLQRPVVLAGCGAIGNAAIWALARAEATGLVCLVDHETVELGNIQRYVLTTRADEGRAKVDIAARELTRSLRPVPRQMTLADFLADEGYDHDRVLLALDSARDRRQAQASLPRWIANAWTQTGDLGVSVHSFGVGACVSCLYLPEGKTSNEDELVAGALKVPERLMEVRLLLHTGGGVARPLLEAAATKLGVPIENLLPFEGKPIRLLYVEGICGGAVVPLGEQMAGAPQNMHVPLAHQSALAGLLLAAALIRESSGTEPATTMVTRINLMQALGVEVRQLALADSRGICICQDPDYRARYAEKFAPNTTAG